MGGEESGISARELRTLPWGTVFTKLLPVVGLTHLILFGGFVIKTAVVLSRLDFLLVFTLSIGLGMVSVWMIQQDIHQLQEHVQPLSITTAGLFVTLIFPPLGVINYFLQRRRWLTSTWHSKVERLFDELDIRLSPFMDYEEYLDKPTHETIWSELEKAIEVWKVAKEIPEQFFSVQVSETELDEFQSRIDDYHARIDNREQYNEKFVRIERHRHKDLFTDVGPENISLTNEQQEAVIRDEVHNRIIAGAGTGKTLVLITRVAYLHKRREIKGDDILVVTFTNEAADEMEQRLRDYFDISDITVTTLHSFGYGILRETHEDALDVFGPNDLDNLISGVINKESDFVSTAFYEHLQKLLLYWDLPEITEEEFEKEEDYINHLRNKTYETFRGEEVKSRAEKLIADMLHTNQVEYRYEQLATWADTASDKDEYRPDFYLPEYDIYIEHLGIDSSGEVAPWFSRDTSEYTEKVVWAREQFEDSDNRLLETYQFEYDVGRLSETLLHRMRAFDVEIDEMDHTELIEETYEFREIDKELIDTFNQFISLARTFRVTTQTVESRLSSDQRRQYHFGMCGIELLDRYEEHLDSLGMIDFTDMIHQAAELLSREDGPSRDYEHVLVDEFQDISTSQIELLEELVGVGRANLFAVGDDWQSIYSFQGAVVETFISFDDHFSPSQTTRLERNYRSPPRIVEAGNDLISNNETQVNKTVYPDLTAETKILLHTVGGYSDYDYYNYTAAYTVDLVLQYLDEECDPGDVMVLCRYDDAVRFLDLVKSGLADAGVPYTGKSTSDGENNTQASTDHGAVNVYSVHQAKGREADHVILVHASEGAYGFPATGRDSKLLAPVREVDMNTVEEERRLFYVALTRAKKTLDFISRDEDVTRFVDEIDQYIDKRRTGDQLVELEAGDRKEALKVKVAKLYHDTHNKIYQRGILEDHTGSIFFVSWRSNDPPRMDEGSWYEITNIRIDEYNDNLEIVLQRGSTVTEISEETAQVTIQTLRDRI